MSSRARRNKVSNERMKAVVRLSPDGDEAIESAIDYAQKHPAPNGNPQAVFRGRLRHLAEGIEREPLSLDRSASAERQALARIQKNNNRREFDLLNDHFGSYLASVEESYLRSDFIEWAEGLDDTFEAARRQLQELRLKNHPAEWSALAVRAAKTFRERSKSIFQHSGDTHVFDAARLIWPDAKALTDSQIGAFLACNQAHIAVDALCKLLERFDQTAIGQGLARNDDERIEKLCWRMKRTGQWDGEIKYISARRDLARECLALSKLLNQKEQTRAVQDEIKEKAAEIFKLSAQLRKAEENVQILKPYKKFADQRGKKIGELRKMIRGVLEDRQNKGLTIKRYEYTCAAIWEEIKRNPPKGFRIIGDVIEYRSGEASYRRFMNSFNKEREKLSHA